MVSSRYVNDLLKTMERERSCGASCNTDATAAAKSSLLTYISQKVTTFFTWLELEDGQAEYAVDPGRYKQGRMSFPGIISQQFSRFVLQATGRRWQNFLLE